MFCTLSYVLLRRLRLTTLLEQPLGRLRVVTARLGRLLTLKLNP